MAAAHRQLELRVARIQRFHSIQNDTVGMLQRLHSSS